MRNGDSSSKVGLIIGALIVGGIVGFFIGRQAGPGPSRAVTEPRPISNVAPTPLPLPTPTEPRYASDTAKTDAAVNPCNGAGVKYLTVDSVGAPSCIDVEIYPANGDQVKWTAPAGSTLVLTFKNPSAFPNKSCGLNTCDSKLPASTAYSSTQDYALQVYLKGTPTPGPTTPTPIPNAGAHGHIIIKP
jgi:hypothetical protein